LRRRRVGLSRGEEEERKGGGERLTGGAQPSASAGIKERKEEGGGPLREGVDGPLGRRAEKGKGKFLSFVFFFKLFSNQTFPFKFKPKFFKPFYKFL
jgi:hypothetical protein